MVAELQELLANGVWSPRGRDVSDIADFARALSAEVGPVSRIALNPTGWSAHPRLVDLGGRNLRIDWFDSAPVDVVSVRRGYRPRLLITIRP